MLKMNITEFRDEIKTEMLGYEEITEALVEKWFENFEAFIDAKRPSGLLEYKGSQVEVMLKDETDLFMMVDRYLAAIVNEDLDNYFTDWTF
ncbi:hypothetical protein [Petrocella sp. FN5]|uniref:hypothetical protein n=1 Tax=Petrocella sp. FN5 TaxID=3032002 RepID=UPI0023DC9B4B|nr:hypothetical protein [Petrocella sp. FN5]MDF1616700.1 hypothetical protein [Petrocella sp. FN5]